MSESPASKIKYDVALIEIFHTIELLSYAPVKIVMYSVYISA